MGTKLSNHGKMLLLGWIVIVTWKVVAIFAQTTRPTDTLEEVRYTGLAKRTKECVFVAGKNEVGSHILIDACLNKVSFVISEDILASGGLRSIQFLSPLKGWGVADKELFQINEEVMSMSATRDIQSAINVVHFRNSMHGWAAGDDGVLFTTANGGKTWIKQKSGTDADLHSISSPTHGKAWIAGWKHKYPDQGDRDFYIIRTYDYGKTWSIVRSPELQGIEEINFVDAKHGFARSAGGQLVFSQDGGKKWNRMTGPENVLKLYFFDSKHGWLLNEKWLYRTEDGGKNWRQSFELPEGFFAEFSEIVFLNRHDGWMISSCCLLRTTDGGRIWQEVFPRMNVASERVLAKSKSGRQE